MAEHWMDETPTEYWTDAEIGAFLRSQGHKVKDTSVRAWRSIHGITAEKRSSADQVREIEASLPGSGRRKSA